MSRFDHSLGVMLLLRKFKTPLNEQIAGLLHDISHTAFSHVVDFVFGSEKTHDYQDKKMLQAFELQGINRILKKYQINPAEILNEKNFPLLERKLPDLCADRIDYTLREPWFNRLSKIKPKEFLNHLKVDKKHFVFVDKNWAKKFGLVYLKLDQVTWCTPLQASLYQILAEAIKIGLKKNYH
ncbi:MAG: hypothetical protein A2729_01790 [Candidatus Buchananbacteria bacterium RIFCSPHIGHO2_01_FULL_39_14]|uniref:HD domain-containing protein n=2 Tax=Candidatus Buchananiibacteriota TaxID=1817903 RepID=A0A1G1YP66_9BACT|nr:MAG: hypothetical protein A2729_01790 [Candidatus Buchananbacteria bacterium RIFCSPHIGHO2_01_FULL_39_14]OGY49718.1 MAG: hypothetical protein A3D39_04330 [Candidatus Buchananbacteria bacterium RIFCSPHIGHO2_02_FULL_39_17]OGY54069.1 MAG: hypothetical protein A2912_01715 [Candidatus Buchananbacteria bacterium RIFCSPLOWO2_01_FULL_40_23b]